MEQLEPDLEWRSPTWGDHAFLEKLIHVTIRHLFDFETPEQEAQWNAMVASTYGLPWQIVSLDGVSVGGIAAGCLEDVAYIYCLHVLPEYQNRGIGSAMLQAIIDWAANRNLPLHLHVGINNPSARRLYERHGFVVDCEEQGFFIRNYRMILLPAKRMSKRESPVPPFIERIIRWLLQK
jgi:ribosomal protein S18 acetylase RimI-like enzyme